MSSFVSWAGKVLDSVDEGAASALQKALKRDDSQNPISPSSIDAQQSQPIINNDHPASVRPVNSTAAESASTGSKDDQIIGLTKIWNETRDELARLKALLRSRDDVHRQAMQNLRDQMDARVSETIQSSSERISILEQRLQEKSSSRELLQNQVDIMKQEIEEISEKNSRLIQEKDELQLELNQAIADRSRPLQALQEEFDRKVKELQDNALAASGSLQQFRDLEAKLLSEKELYTNALVQADRDLQKMASAARSAQEERQRLQAECNMLQLKLNESQIQLQKVLPNQQDSAQQIARAEERLAAALQAQAESFQNERIRLENRINMLSAQLRSSSVDSGLAAKAETLQRKVETLTATLLQRQSEIERMGSVSSTLGSQLDQERSRCLQLEEERRLLQQRLSEMISSADYDDNFKRRRLRPYQHRLTSKFLDFFGNDIFGFSIPNISINRVLGKRRLPLTVPELDGVGTTMTRVMRGSARIRIGMVIYIIVLHIWVVYILSHLASPATAPTPARL